MVCALGDQINMLSLLPGHLFSCCGTAQICVATGPGQPTSVRLTLVHGQVSLQEGQFQLAAELLRFVQPATEPETPLTSVNNGPFAPAPSNPAPMQIPRQAPAQQPVRLSVLWASGTLSELASCCLYEFCGISVILEDTGVWQFAAKHCCWC